jgi:hypothetical protein
MIFNFFFVQMILHFQNEVSVIMYIIEFVFLIQIISFEKKFNKIWNFQSLCFCNV